MAGAELEINPDLDNRKSCPPGLVEGDRIFYLRLENYIFRVLAIMTFLSLVKRDHQINF